jgi:hypothetical protein
VNTAAIPDATRLYTPLKEQLAVAFRRHADRDSLLASSISRAFQRAVLRWLSSTARSTPCMCSCALKG